MGSVLEGARTRVVQVPGYGDLMYMAMDGLVRYMLDYVHECVWCVWMRLATSCTVGELPLVCKCIAFP